MQPRASILLVVAFGAGCASSRGDVPAGWPPARDVGGIEAQDAPAPISLPVAPPVAPKTADPPELFSDAPRSAALACGLYNPMPGSILAGYAADTGLDLAGMPSPVHAIAAGTIAYAEDGHTRWRGRNDAGYAALPALDE